MWTYDKIELTSRHYRNASSKVLLIEFLHIQIPTGITSGTRSRATPMLTNKFNGCNFGLRADEKMGWHKRKQIPIKKRAIIFMT